MGCLDQLAVVVDRAAPLQMAKIRGRWGRAAGTFGVDGDVVELGRRHLAADLAFDDRVDHEGNEVTCHEALYAGRVVQEHRATSCRAFGMWLRR